eukprot:TRINITY_DN64223_c0_g1_i1.p1 TRINITY_DN64223_c0_g1~~TRINITY_DN64223_c0_g1_i1.p1  ORF type:complete len:528 (+),score=98.98 TRINITY_DN64223_c0_g1_i1:240-1586(+)
MVFTEHEAFVPSSPPSPTSPILSGSRRGSLEDRGSPKARLRVSIQEPTCSASVGGPVDAAAIGAAAAGDGASTRLAQSLSLPILESPNQRGQPRGWRRTSPAASGFPAAGGPGYGNSSSSGQLPGIHRLFDRDCSGNSGGATLLPQLAGGGSNGSGGGSARKLRLRGAAQGESLEELPVREALRQALLRQTSGDLRRAFQAFDVDGSGKVSASDFERGLVALGLPARSPLGYDICARRLFDQLSKGSPKLSLRELFQTQAPVELPRMRTSLSQAFDTRTMWLDYHNKTTALEKSRPNERKPAWRDPVKEPQRPRENVDSGPAALLNEDDVSRRRRRREMKQKLREARCELHMNAKRELVGGLCAPEEATERKEEDDRKVMMRGNRIKGAIRQCSRARMQLVDMQKVMSHLSDCAKPPLQEHHMVDKARGAVAIHELKGNLQLLRRPLA